MDKWPKKMPMPRTSNWLEVHGSWENFCKHIAKSTGRPRQSGILKSNPSFKNPLRQTDIP